MRTPTLSPVEGLPALSPGLLRLALLVCRGCTKEKRRDAKHRSQDT
jgi:hypothetical protein